MAEDELSNPLTEPRAAVFRLTEVNWGWLPGGQLLAKGKLQVTREPNATPAILTFEIPIIDPPSRGVFENPQEWVVALVRRTMRT